MKMQKITLKTKKWKKRRSFKIMNASKKCSPKYYNKQWKWLALCRIGDFQVQQLQETSTQQKLVEKIGKIWWLVWIRQNPVYHWSFGAINQQLIMHPDQILNHKSQPTLDHYHMSSENWNFFLSKLKLFSFKKWNCSTSY